MPLLIVCLSALLWGWTFAGLAVARHEAGGTHAEDLGFTDQVIWNFLRGQWFRMTLYQGVTWDAEVDVARLARPDSLLAFHVEPMLLLFVPAYLFGAGARFLLVLQASALALGSVPAYRLGLRLTGSAFAGIAVAAAYLLSPFGQFAVLADFHTTALAAPLLLLSIERLAAGAPRAAILAAVVGLSAREDVGPVVAGLGLAAVIAGHRRPGAVLAVLGLWWTVVSMLIIGRYAGGASPFTERYAAILGDPGLVVELLTRDVVLGYVGTLMLAGGWLGMLAPLSLLPALPVLTLNALATSPWMASGKAHYSVLLLPFLTAGAAVGLARVQTLARRLRAPGTSSTQLTVTPLSRWAVHVGAMALLVTSGTAYLAQGAGPLAQHYAAPWTTERTRTALVLAADLDPSAGVSASASLVPHLSQRARVYVFPAVEDADYVLLDVTASPAPTSAGDVFLRVRDLLAAGGWVVAEAADGILLLARAPAATPSDVRDLPARFFTFTRGVERTSSADMRADFRQVSRSGVSFVNGHLELLGSELVRSPTAMLEPDGRRDVLRTTWRLARPLPPLARPTFTLDLGNGRQVQHGEIAALWWHPVEQWIPGDVVTLDILGVPAGASPSWDVTVAVTALASVETTPEGGRGETTPEDGRGSATSVPPEQRFPLGDLTLVVEPDPWRLHLLSPAGERIWSEALDTTIGFRTEDGSTARAVRLTAAHPGVDGAVRLIAEVDDPTGRQIAVEARSVVRGVVRLTVAVSPPAGVVAVGGGVVASPDERFVGFGERFDGINQRGRIVDVWAEDRVLAEYGPSTYAPLPLLLSSQGYGAALERYERSRFDLAATRADRWTWEQDSATASLLLSYGPDLRALVEHQTQVWGRPPLPPIWAFGVWKTAVGGQDAVLGEATRLRQQDVPVSAIFAYDAVDHEANIGWPSVNYAGRRAGPYPDQAGFTTALRRLGFRTLNYFRADVHQDQPGYAEPASQGLLVRRSDGAPYVHPQFPASWLDFTNPRAVTWWRGLWVRALSDLGYDGGMLDVGEILPPDAVMWDGSDGTRAHNRYPLLYAQSAWDHALAVRPDGDFVLFARSGAQGAHRYQSLQWPGDVRMEWDGPGGLQAVVPAALSFGLSGYPYFHAEVAGYVQAGLSHEDERELWLRWLQLATWTATLRDHYGDHPVSPVDAWLDAETLHAFREAARIHNSLVPYLYTHAQEAAQTGLPLMRFLALEAPTDPQAWMEEQSFFLGPSLLVAPVVERGATTRTAYLPDGEWVDFWTGDRYAGRQHVTVAAPLDGGRAPVFVRAGAILPLAPEFDTLVATDQPGVRTYTGDLVVRVFPGGGARELTLYDGTRLYWDGLDTMRVAANAQPRTITVISPVGITATSVLVAADGEIRVP